VLARGAATFDEPELDGLAHALQCGHLLAASYPDDPELAVAGLVHDIADVVYPDEHARHDELGAALVAPLLGRRVAHLVGSHVVAKRYLVTADASYRNSLSPRSVETLAAQGDVLDQVQIAVLERDPDFDAIISLRRADERAKDPHARVPGLDSWRVRLEAVSASS
jgi:gamma-butyrobetaine dioxygenase